MLRLTISDEHLQQLTALQLTTGTPADKFLEEAIEDWLATCAPTHRDRALKALGVAVMPSAIVPLGGSK